MNAHSICPTAIVGEVLKGKENYANWRACMQNYFSVRDLWDVVVEETLPEGISDEADLKAWRKRNVSALHAIQISCAPTVLSCIRDKNTAKDAWNTLAQMCQPPPVPAEHEDEDEDAVEQQEDEQEHVLQPGVEVVERPRALDLLNSINTRDLETIKLILTGLDFYPLQFAMRLGKPEIIGHLLCHMSEEDVKVQDELQNTALHYTAMTGHTKIAERLIIKNKELLTIPERRGYIPLNTSCIAGDRDMTHYLYKMTTPAYLLSPENRPIAASVVCDCIASNLLDIALDLLRRCPELAVTKAIGGGSAVEALSCQPSLFPSGSELSFWQRRIYSDGIVMGSVAVLMEYTSDELYDPE